MQNVCTSVCSAVVLYAFEITHGRWVQYWYCGNAVPPFSEHKNIPPCGTLGDLRSGANVTVH